MFIIKGELDIAIKILTRIVVDDDFIFFKLVMLKNYLVVVEYWLKLLLILLKNIYITKIN